MTIEKAIWRVKWARNWLNSGLEYLTRVVEKGNFVQKSLAVDALELAKLGIDNALAEIEK
ncbi:MAG: hypothetical protein ACFFDT_07725 [Candidatus Hodarchaeota archaeon]